MVSGFCGFQSRRRLAATNLLLDERTGDLASRDLGLSAEIPLLPTIDPQSDEYRSGRDALVES
jgi:hypothetical protein